jgi:hypothetical protein
VLPKAPHPPFPARHSNALVDILPPEADSTISVMAQSERPDVSYQDIGGLDIQKQVGVGGRGRGGGEMCG